MRLLHSSRFELIAGSTSTRNINNGVPWPSIRLSALLLSCWLDCNTFCNVPDELAGKQKRSVAQEEAHHTGNFHSRPGAARSGIARWRLSVGKTRNLSARCSTLGLALVAPSALLPSPACWAEVALNNNSISSNHSAFDQVNRLQHQQSCIALIRWSSVIRAYSSFLLSRDYLRSTI